jgi:nuclear pore complex protein Nup160
VITFEVAPCLLIAGRTILTSKELVGMFVQRGMYDDALRAGVSLQVDLSDLFVSLAQRCVHLTSPSNGSYEPSTKWLFKSPITSNLRGPPSALAMRYLQVALQRHDSKKTNWKYRKVVSEQFMRMNKAYRGSWKIPSWLVDAEMERDAEGWIARALKEGWVVQAVEWSSDLIRRVSI